VYGLTAFSFGALVLALLTARARDRVNAWAADGSPNDPSAGAGSTHRLVENTG
jgi:hypothetical protein